MDYYHYSVELPFSKKVIKFREFTTDEQLAIGKAKYSFSNDLTNYHIFIRDIIGKCVLDPFEFDKINIIEYILFLTKLRIISVSPKMELYTYIDGQRAKITLDLNILMQNIFTAVESVIEDLDFPENDKIVLDFPKASDMVDLVSVEQDINSIIDTIPLFVQKAGNTSNHVDIKKLYGKLPISISNSIQSKIFDVLKRLSEREIFGIEVFKDFKINFYNNAIFELIKLLCSYDIKQIHQEIYMLSAMNPEYVKSLSPSERNVYIAFFLQEKAPKEKGEPSVPQNPVDALAAEFGQEPLKSDDPI